MVFGCLACFFVILSVFVSILGVLAREHPIGPDLFYFGVGCVCAFVALAIALPEAESRARESKTFWARLRAYSGIVFRLAPFVLLAVPIIVSCFQGARENPNRKRAFCQNNLKQFGLVFRMFAGEKMGMYPQLAVETGRLMFAIESKLYPEYLADPTIFVCPDQPDEKERLKKLERPESLRASDEFNPDPRLFIIDASYVYLGYAVTNDSELRAFAAAYKDRIAKGLPFDIDLDVPPGTSTGGGDKILRLREGVERMFITDAKDPNAAARAQSRIPIMWDRCRFDPNTKPENWFSHKSGANVLFMDGHVEFVKYQAKFPVTGEACRVFSELEALKPQ